MFRVAPLIASLLVSGALVPTTARAIPCNIMACTDTLRGPCEYCDVADNCTRKFHPQGFQCHVAADTTANPCDQDRFCNGLSYQCPPTLAEQDGEVVCRPAVSVCDVEETCGLGQTACPPNQVAPAGGLCRGVSVDGRIDACDEPEYCNGTSPSCPVDGAKSNGTPCADAAGDCDVADTCNGTSQNCPQTVKPVGTVCRLATEICDVTDECTGTSPDCPADELQDAGIVCRPALPAHTCDVPETCTGTNAQCPDDAKATSAQVCRPAAGECDTAERCAGGDTCPADTLLDDASVCRASAGPCDPEERCNGASVECPANAFVPTGTVCDPATHSCELAGVCSGSGAACSSRSVIPNGGACDDGNPCTEDDVCSAASCAGTTVAACMTCQDAAECDDGDPCNGAETCTGGACRAGTPLDCDDGNACTNDSCVAGVGCAHAAAEDGTSCSDGRYCTIADRCDDGVCVGGGARECGASPNPCQRLVCNDAGAACLPVNEDDGKACSDDTECTHDDACLGGSCVGVPDGACVPCWTHEECDDGDACTGEACDLSIHICRFHNLVGCCSADAACDDGNACTSDACTGAPARCVHGGTPACCAADADCDDGDACTVGTCERATGTCRFERRPGCCATDLDCEDASTCTMDVCNTATHTCTHQGFPGCCGAAEDCDDGNFCTEDTCDANGTCQSVLRGNCCTHDVECDDGDACTADRCADNTCVHPLEPECVPPPLATVYGCASTGASSLLAVFAVAIVLLARRRRGAPLLLALAMALVTPARADDGPKKKPSLVFFGVTAEAGVDPGLAKAVSEFVLSQLGSLNAYTVIGQSDVHALLSLEQDKQLMGCTAARCYASIGDALGAERLVVGTLAQVGDSLLLNVSLLDVAQAQGLSRVGRRVDTRESIENVLDAVRPAVRELVVQDPAVDLDDRDALRAYLGGRVDAETSGGFIAGVSGSLEVGWWGVAGVVFPRPWSPPDGAPRRPVGLRLEGRVYPGYFVFSMPEWLRPYAALGTTVFGEAVGARVCGGANAELGPVAAGVDFGYERLVTDTASFESDALLVGASVALRL